MHHKLIASLCLALLLLITPFAAYGQTATPAVSILSVDDSQFPELTLLLRVVDSGGQPVEGLTAADIVVLEDDAPAEVVSVDDAINTEQGIGIVLVIDVSGSMAGRPLEDAKTAATNFVSGLGPNDRVAVLSFANAVDTVLPFTDDVAAAGEAIQGLQVGGETALYDSAYQGVLAAAQADLPQRVVILLGDGNESGVSLAGPEEAFQAARDNGVAIHTIALGAAAETPYFQQLSGLTGGVALSTPSSDQLASLWEELSTLLRQQVQVVVRSGVPGDSKSHSITVQINVGANQAEAASTFTSQPVTPTIAVAGLAEGEQIDADTRVTAEVAAQGEVATVTFSLDGKVIEQLEAAPWRTTLTPQTMRSGDHTLEIEAADESGVTGTTTLNFWIAPLPPEVTVNMEEGHLLEAPLSLTPEFVAQASVEQVVVSIDGQVVENLTESPFRFVLDPKDIAGGAHILAVSATDEDGQSNTVEIGFSVSAAQVETAPGASPGIATNIVPIGVGVAAVALIAVLVVLALRRRPMRPEPGPELYLEVVAGLRTGQQFEVTTEPQLIGRVSTAAIRIPDPTSQLKISREHARVWREGDMAFIEDAGSTHGTIVNGVKISHKTVLPDGGHIRLGGVEMIYHGIPSEADDMRATTLAVDEQLGVDAGDARDTHIKLQPTGEPTPPSDEGDELRETKQKPQAGAGDAGDEGDELRETKQKPQAGTGDSDDEEEEIRRTRRKP